MACVIALVAAERSASTITTSAAAIDPERQLLITNTRHGLEVCNGGPIREHLSALRRGDRVIESLPETPGCPSHQLRVSIRQQRLRPRQARGGLQARDLTRYTKERRGRDPRGRSQRRIRQRQRDDHGSHERDASCPDPPPRAILEVTQVFVPPNSQDPSPSKNGPVPTSISLTLPGQPSPEPMSRSNLSPTSQKVNRPTFQGPSTHESAHRIGLIWAARQV